MKHTPGPWKWWTSNSWKRLKRDSENYEQVLSPFNAISDGHPNVDITEADMHLIAAAPEMYDALRCWPLNELLGMVEDSGDEQMRERAKWFIEVRDFAIKKAEGK